MQSFDVTHTTIYNYPKVFTSRHGEPIVIRLFSKKQLEQLIYLYLKFTPRPCFNDLPPPSDSACVKWVHNMIADGINMVAYSLDTGIIGHAALFPMDEKKCEMLLAVSPRYQLRGIGTQMIHSIVQLAYEVGFQKVWLAVNTSNFIAKHLYGKCGFKFLPDSDLDEVQMILDLHQYHRAANIVVQEVMNRDVITVPCDMSGKKIIEMFLQNNIAAMPVIDKNNKIIGVVSEADLIIEENAYRIAKEVATRNIITVREDSSLETAVRLLQSAKIRCIPVLNDKEELVGILGRKDILAYYYNTYIK